jgi:hypothetical protein
LRRRCERASPGAGAVPEGGGSSADGVPPEAGDSCGPLALPPPWRSSPSGEKEQAAPSSRAQAPIRTAVGLTITTPSLQGESLKRVVHVPGLTPGGIYRPALATCSVPWRMVLARSAVRLLSLLVALRCR